MDGPAKELECAAPHMPHVYEKIARAKKFGGSWTSYWEQELAGKTSARCTAQETLNGIARMLTRDGYSVVSDREYFPPTINSPGRFVPHISVEWPRA